MEYHFLRWVVFICLFIGMNMDIPPDLNSFVPGDLIEPEQLDSLYSKGQYEDLGKTLQLDGNYLKPYTGNPRSEWELLNNNGQGDIMFTPQQKNNRFGTNRRRVARQGVKFDNVYYSRWPTFVHYTISKNFTKENRQIIEDAITDFNLQIQDEFFIKRITGQKDYVMFFDGYGCSSHIGKIGGPQAIILSQFGCMMRGKVQHEMFHTVGMIHEHTRPDRDQYVKILFENIPEDWKDQYTEYSAEFIDILGDYDYYSIMHYPVYAPTNPDKIAIEILESGVKVNKVGQRNEMTETDVKKVRKLYKDLLL